LLTHGNRRVFWTARVAAASGRKYASAISFILCRLLFLYEWCVSSYDDLFIASDPFPPSFLSYIEKSTLALIIIDISNSLILVFIFDFLSFFLLLKFFFFNLTLQF
jgi:hypothetical protein